MNTGITVAILMLGEIIEMNKGTDFMWAKDLEDRNVLWNARHNAWYAAISLRPGSKVCYLCISHISFLHVILVLSHL